MFLNFYLINYLRNQIYFVSLKIAFRYKYNEPVLISSMPKKAQLFHLIEMQMKPSNAPAMENSKEKNRTSETVAVSQIWQKSGSCPNGTIPIRRVGKQDLLRANSLENFGRKSPQIMYTFSQTGRNGKIISSLNYTTTNLGTQENRSVRTPLSLLSPYHTAL